MRKSIDIFESNSYFIDLKLQNKLFNMLVFMNFRIIACLSALVLTAASSFATTSRYRLSWRDNPATSMVVGWNQDDGEDPVLYCSTKDYGTNVSKYKTKFAVSRTVKYGHLNNFFVRFNKLKPNTVYYFLIKDSNSTSKRFSFRTAPSKPTKLAFIAGGDSRTLHDQRILGNRLVAKLRPLFILFGGDFTNSGKPSHWDKWLVDWQKTISEDGRMYPMLPAMGNHEYYAGKDTTMLGEIFDTANDDAYFVFGFAGNMLRTYVLNSEISRYKERWAAQTKWLMQDLLANKKATWKVAIYHKPMRPHTKGKGEANYLVSAWAYLFHDFGMDLAIESDTHLVKRTFPLRPSTEKGSEMGFIRDDKTGTTYIGEGGWGAPLKPLNDTKSWTKESAAFMQFKWIQVTPKKLSSVVVKFENVDKVQALTDKTRFKLPKGISIWKPASGPVLKLLPRKK